MSEKCDVCQHDCWREGVDIGVGIEYGPWRCARCGWTEDDWVEEHIEPDYEGERGESPNFQEEP